jgi:hypothetical protein
MRLAHGTLLALLGAAIAAPAESHGDNSPPPCRFALQWSQDQILAKTDEFIWDMLYWEGKFHQDGIAYNQVNGMSYDGSQIDWVTGERTEKHTFSAASKEVTFPTHRLTSEPANYAINTRRCKSCSTPAPSMAQLKPPDF